MLIDPVTLANDLDRLEAIEKASLRLVAQALFDYRKTAAYIFENETDTVADIGEDITREALDRMGISRIDQRLFGKIDYKRAAYLFLPDFAIRQALFVDSKGGESSRRSCQNSNYATLHAGSAGKVWTGVRYSGSAANSG